MKSKTMYIPFLPDFLADHTLLAEDQSGRATEQLERWAVLVGALWSEGAAYSLSFFWSGHEDFQILQNAHSHTFAKKTLHVWISSKNAPEQSLRLLGTIGIPLQDDDKECRLGALQALFTGNQQLHCHAVRQLADWTQFTLNETESLYAEEIQGKYIRFRDNSSMQKDSLLEVFVPATWQKPAGPFVLPFRALSTCDQPLWLEVITNAVPRDLVDSLRLSVSEATTKLAMLDRGQTMSSLHQGGSEAKANPFATLASSQFVDLLPRLFHAYAVAAFCLSHSEEDSRRVAGAFANTISEEKPKHDDTRRAASLVTRSEVFKVETDCQPLVEDMIQNSHLTLEDLQKIDPFPSEEQELLLLRYITDASGAATAFRLPIAVREGLEGIAVKEVAPDYLVTENSDNHQSSRHSGAITLGRLRSGKPLRVHVCNMTRHTLVVGFTGSGKTVTCLQLLHQLWVDHNVPFLAIESAKHEYRGLIRVKQIAAMNEQIRVYTAGNETGIPFRINPFQLLHGIRVEAHISKLQTCFEAAIPQDIGATSSLIAEALYECYLQKGWVLTDCFDESQEERRLFPTMTDFVEQMERLIDKRYVGEIQANVRGALIGRLRPLLIASKGLMLDVQTSSPSIKDLFSKPVILELNELNLEDKALVSLFLLTFLREYRETDKLLPPPHGLRHVTLIEEAHNVLENVGSEGSGEGSSKADTRYKAVQTICGMLAEVRALGEGIIIADQSPVKLARDAIRNTNLQIAHQIRDKWDREAVGTAMVMDESQREFIGKVILGQAAVFYAGLEKATFMQVDKYCPDSGDRELRPGESESTRDDRLSTFRGYGYSESLELNDIKEHMLRLDKSATSKPVAPYKSCKTCKVQCSPFRISNYQLATEGSELRTEFRRFLVIPKIKDNDGKEIDGSIFVVSRLQDAGRALAKSLSGCWETKEEVEHRSWCLFIHLWEALQVSEDSTYDRQKHSLQDWQKALFDEYVLPEIKDEKRPKD